MKLSINPDAETMLKTSQFPDVLSVKQTQEILGICRISVYKQIENKKLEAFCIGRTFMIPKESVRKFINARKESDRV